MNATKTRATHHQPARITTNNERHRETRTRVRCVCGHLSYGADRLGALDGWAVHKLNERTLAAFRLVNAQA